MHLIAAPRRHAGFTIIELMVTLALLALILMTAIPNISSWLRNIQIRNTAESLQNGLQKARTEAINRNRVVRFSLVKLNDVTDMDNTCELSNTGISWVVSLDDPNGQCGTAPSPTTEPRILAAKAGGDGGNKTTVIATGIAGSPSTKASSVLFDNYGRISGTLTIQTIDVSTAAVNDETRTLRLVLTQSGGVRMCDPAVSAAGDPRKC